MSASLKGTSVIVTGGSKGIGKGIARMLKVRYKRLPNPRLFTLRLT